MKHWDCCAPGDETTRERGGDTRPGWDAYVMNREMNTLTCINEIDISSGDLVETISFGLLIFLYAVDDRFPNNITLNYSRVTPGASWRNFIFVNGSGLLQMLSAWHRGRVISRMKDAIG